MEACRGVSNRWNGIWNNGGMEYGMDGECTQQLNHLTDALLSLD